MWLEQATKYKTCASGIPHASAAVLSTCEAALLGPQHQSYEQVLRPRTQAPVHHAHGPHEQALQLWTHWSGLCHVLVWQVQLGNLICPSQGYALFS